MTPLFYDYCASEIGLIEVGGSGDEILTVEFVEPRRPETASNAVVREGVRQIDEYMRGERREFDLPLGLYGTEFQRRVWRQLLTVPYGQTATYQEIADAIGNSKAVRAVGATAERRVDVRVVAATNRDLEKDVAEGKFREDLFYRLNVIPIHIPPLRKRGNDIPLLSRHFLKRFAAEQAKDVKEFSSDAMRLLLDYPWPGNVRELENLIERSVALTDEPTLQPHDLPPDLQRIAIDHSYPWPSLEEKESEYIRQVLIKTDYKKALAAQILKIPRTTLWRKMKRLGLI